MSEAKLNEESSNLLHKLIFYVKPQIHTDKSSEFICVYLWFQILLADFSPKKLDKRYQLDEAVIPSPTLNFPLAILKVFELIQMFALAVVLPMVFLLTGGSFLSLAAICPIDALQQEQLLQLLVNSYESRRGVRQL